MQTQVRADVSRLVKALTKLGERNIPFAVARALTDLAMEIREGAKPRLKRLFHIRTTWVERGFRVVSADYRTAPGRGTIEARVGHKDPYMALQQTGGDKLPKGREQAIPQAGSALGAGMQMPRGSAGERTTPRGSNWPRHLIAAIESMKARQKAGKKSRNKAAKNKLVFLEHARIPTIAVRIANGRGTKGQFKPLWFLYSRPVDIPKRWDFLERGEAYAQRNYQRVLYRRVREAIK